MRRIRSYFALMFVVPLAACFDAELSINFPDEDRAEATMVIVASPEFYAMATTGEESFCEGEETMNEAGDHVCTETVSGTIDEVVNNPDIGEGMTIERRVGGLIYVAFDLGELTEEISPPEEDGTEEMIEMMRAAFEGHAITLNLSGEEVLETNGTISEDGTTATYEIPLSITLDGSAELPESFNALIRPGG